MFYTYNYFRQHNDDKEIADFKEFYKKFSNEREFGGEFEHFDHLVKSRLFETFGTMLNIVLRARPTKILDIGCGAGVNLPLAKIFDTVQYVGVDYAEKSVEAARSQYPEATFVPMDAFNLKFSDNEFNMSIISSVLILYEKESDRIKLLNEAARVTDFGNGGCVVAVVWKDSFLLKASVFISRFLAKKKNIQLPEDFNGIHFTENEARSMFEKANLQVCEVYHTGQKYGFLESIRYLFMKKYTRSFGKTESEAQVTTPQNVYDDIYATCFSHAALKKINHIQYTCVKIIYKISKICPSLFNMFSIYVLTEKK